MSLQDILNKIKIQAQRESEQIRTDSDQALKKVHDEYEKEEKQALIDLETQVEKKISGAKRKSESLAHMYGKRMVLEKKQAIIDNMLGKILSQISSIPAKDYEQVLVQLMSSIDITEGVIIPAQGKENSTKGAIKLSKKNFKVGDSGDFRGGFILKSDTADYDMRFETLVYKTFKEKFTQEIRQQLFLS
jgi:V/A-type H+/Na+-transporting ATPase subunit E